MPTITTWDGTRRDYTEDLKLDAPTLFLHRDDDQIVPIAASALRASISSETGS
jgi:hypothetical protein